MVVLIIHATFTRIYIVYCALAKQATVVDYGTSSSLLLLLR